MRERDLFGDLENQGKEVAVSENTSQALAVFNYNGKALDYGLLNGEPIFNLNAIGDLLNMTNPRMSIDVSDSDYVIKVDNSIVSFAYNRKLHNTGELFLTESGLYMLLMRSNNPNAKPFQKWVTKEVLPSIRKTGSYSLAQPQLPKTYAEALRELADKVEKVAELESKIETDKPLVEYATDILLVENSQSIGDFAKFLASRGCTTGQNRLFAWLRANHFLKSDNTAYQKYVDCGYFQMLPQAYKNGDKRTLTWKTLITPKGQYYLTKYFLGNEKANDKLLADIQSGKIKANIVDFGR